MKYWAFLVLIATVSSASAQVGCVVSIALSPTGTVFALDSQPLTLDAIQTRLEQMVSRLDTNASLVPNVVPLGDAPAPALIQVFATLRRAGVKTALLRLSAKQGGQYLSMKLPIKLDSIHQDAVDPNRFILDANKLLPLIAD
jgi:hypothetical protein